MMAKRKVEAIVVEEVEEDAELLEEMELEELEEDVEVAETETGSSILTAKAAASKLGTDGKTLRKFLRKKYGTIGQGKRWEIDEDIIETLKAEFMAWKKSGAKVEAKLKVAKTKAPAEPLADAELEEFEEIDDLDDIEEV